MKDLMERFTEDMPGTIACLTAEMSEGRGNPEDIVDTLNECILEAISKDFIDGEQLEPYSEFAGAVSERSEGEISAVSKLLTMATGYLEKGNCLKTMFGLTLAAPIGLYLSVDPDEYYEVIDGLASVSMTAVSVEPGNKDLKKLSEGLLAMRGPFASKWHSLDDEDCYFSMADRLANDDEGEIWMSLWECYNAVLNMEPVSEPVKEFTDLFYAL